MNSILDLIITHFRSTGHKVERRDKYKLMWWDLVIDNTLIVIYENGALEADGVQGESWRFSPSQPDLFAALERCLEIAKHNYCVDYFVK